MTSVTVQIAPETERRLRLRASQRGETLEAYLRELAEKEVADDADLLGQGVEWLTHRSAEDVRVARARILDATPPAREIPASMTVLDMVEGKWPGTETDAELRDALDRIS